VWNSIFPDTKSVYKEEAMILQAWFDKLKTFDPDDWGNLNQVRAGFSGEELAAEAEADITFRMHAGVMDQVLIQLVDAQEDVLVDLEYTPFQLSALSVGEPGGLFCLSRSTACAAQTGMLGHFWTRSKEDRVAKADGSLATVLPGLSRMCRNAQRLAHPHCFGSLTER
jgi:hypothetical protein